MNTNSSPQHPNPQGHLLLFRGTSWHENLSPDEIQRTMDDWNAWFEGLRAAGKISAAHPLENEGKLVSGAAKSVTDGPFAESKEAVGGFFLLDVATMDEALEIARGCPALPQGVVVEVRPVAPACPANRLVEEAASRAMTPA